MLWKIENTKLYILGGIHLLSSPARLTPYEMEALRQAERIALEANDELPMPLSGTAYSNGESIEADLEPDLAAELRTFVERQGLSQDVLRLHPWRLNFALVGAISSSLGLSPANGVERLLRAHARRTRTPVLFLETPEESLLPFRQAPLAEVARGIESAVRRPEESVQMLNTLADAWSKRDISLAVPAFEMFKERAPATFENAIEGRNHAWMPKLLEFANGPPNVFCAVGMLHMLGPEGLLRLFEREGYRAQMIG
jgi:uncharacterized protein YbaP (TraB family)